MHFSDHVTEQVYNIMDSLWSHNFYKQTTSKYHQKSYSIRCEIVKRWGHHFLNVTSLQNEKLRNIFYNIRR